MSDKKGTFITQLQERYTRWAQASEALFTLRDIYADREYDTGSASISDVDANPYGIAGSDVAAGITLSTQLENLWTSSSVNRVTINKLRTDM